MLLSSLSVAEKLGMDWRNGIAPEIAAVHRNWRSSSLLVGGVTGRRIVVLLWEANQATSGGAAALGMEVSIESTYLLSRIFFIAYVVHGIRYVLAFANLYC